ALGRHSSPDPRPDAPRPRPTHAAPRDRVDPLPLRGGRPRSALPSFPTRRSSDLRLITHPNVCRIYDYFVSENGSKCIAMEFEPRSEEHTSELQSRGHLVCRLLLEKKKAAILARAGQDINTSSLFRSGYRLLFTPL